MLVLVVMMNIFENKKVFAGIFLIFILLTFFLRLNITTKGHMHFADELRYRYAFSVIDGFKKGDLKEGFSNLFKSYCRPAFISLGLIPASIQRVIDKNVGKGDLPEIERDDLRSYIIPSIFNVFISIGIMLLFYQMLLYITKDRVFSFFGMVFYSMLNTSFMEIRHMQPYYIGMYIFFLIIYRAIRNENSSDFGSRQYLCYGIATGFAFSVYPAFYNLAFMIAAFLFIISKNKIRAAIWITAGFLVFPAIFEVLSQYSGFPNFINKHQMECIYEALPTNKSALSGYFWFAAFAIGVEGIIGAVLTVLFIAFLFKYITDKRSDRKIKIIYILWAVMYLYTVVMMFTLNKFTPRIRYCHPTFFLMAIGMFVFIYNYAKTRMRIAVFLILAEIFSFGFFYNRYIQAVYPRDIRQMVREDYPGKTIIHTAEFYPENMQKTSFYLAMKENVDLLGINLRPPTGPKEPIIPINMGKESEIVNVPQPDSVYTPYANNALNYFGISDYASMKVYHLKKN